MCFSQAPKKEAGEPTVNAALGPGAREGEHVFGVARILASFNDTFVYVPKSRRSGSRKGEGESAGDGGATQCLQSSHALAARLPRPTAPAALPAPPVAWLVPQRPCHLHAAALASVGP